MLTSRLAGASEAWLLCLEKRALVRWPCIVGTLVMNQGVNTVHRKAGGRTLVVIILATRGKPNKLPFANIPGFAGASITHLTGPEVLIAGPNSFTISRLGK